MRRSSVADLRNVSRNRNLIRATGNLNTRGTTTREREIERKNKLQ